MSPSALADWTTIFARYTPGSNPAPEAVAVIRVGPVPEYCVRVSHDVVRLPGNTAAVQDCVLSAGPTVSVTGVCCSCNESGEDEMVVGLEAGPVKETVNSSSKISPNSSVNWITTVLFAGGSIPFQQKVPLSDPYAASRVVPKRTAVNITSRRERSLSV